MEWVMVVVGALMVIGAFLPWWQELSPAGVLIDRNSFRLSKVSLSDWIGVWTILSGLVFVSIGLLKLAQTRIPRLWLAPIVVIAAVLGLYTAVSSYQRISVAVHGEQALFPALFSVGYGILLVVVVAGVAFAFSILDWIVVFVEESPSRRSRRLTGSLNGQGIAVTAPMPQGSGRASTRGGRE